MYFAEKNMYFVCVYYCCMFVLKFTRNIAFDSFINGLSRMMYALFISLL
jgi:uncharacterized ion transporter superfamily protein YfcC